MNHAIEIELLSLRFHLTASDKGITSFRKALGANKKTAHTKNSHLKNAKKALKKYFSGDYSALKNIPLDLKGTPFQLSVWKELYKSKAGNVTTYKQIAKKLNKAGAYRAVARACATNPALVFIPCHRVIASNGKLSGFAAGIELKKYLLEHEGAKKKFS